MLIFLQSLRATLMPLLVVPTALLGALIGGHVAGSIREITDHLPNAQITCGKLHVIAHALGRSTKCAEPSRRSIRASRDCAVCC